MYIIVSVVILSMISAVLFFADAIWITQNSAHAHEEKMQQMTEYAAQAQLALQKSEHTPTPTQRRLERQNFLQLSAAMDEFNTSMDNPEWIKKRFLTDKTSKRNARIFQSKTLQMSQYITQILQAETDRDLNYGKKQLSLLLDINFFKNVSDLLDIEHAKIQQFRDKMALFGWLIIPALAFILAVIWYAMISPMVAHQLRSYKQLKTSQAAALDMAEMALAADAAKAQFLNIVSHELRTPLNGVIGLSDQLLAQTSDDKCRAIAQDVSAKGNDLAVLVNELIALTDAQSNDEFDIQTFMAKVTEKQLAHFKQNQTEKTYTLPADCKVLIADDNRTNRIVMDKLIKRMGASADIVEDGIQALKAFKTNGYDLLMLDIAMPNKTGDAAIRDIRAFEVSQNRPPSIALAVTANTLREEVQGYRDAGFDDCLAKPINFARLSEKIQNLLRQTPDQSA